MNELDQEKLFYERFWALLNDRQLMTVFEKYGPMAFRRSSVLEGFETFIKAHNFKGKCCVEIGTLKGLTAIVMARYFDHVISIDIHDDPLKREIAELLGVQNVEYINVPDNAAKARLIRGLEFDGAYSDGDHHADADSDFALVNRCGQVLMREHWEAQPSVVTLVDGLSNTVKQGKFALWRSNNG